MHFFRAEPDEALAAGERALILNPNDTDLIGQFGGRLVMMTAQRARGEALLREALARNPGHAGYYEGMLAVSLYLDRRYLEAAEAIKQANLPDFHLTYGVAAMIYGQLGWREDARAAAHKFMELHPTFIAHIGAELRKRSLSPGDQAHILDGLRKAGISIPKGALDDMAQPGQGPKGASSRDRRVRPANGRRPAGRTPSEGAVPAVLTPAVTSM